jgi:hypothetical protein
MKKPALATGQGASSLLYRPTRPNSHSQSEGRSRARAVTNRSNAALRPIQEWPEVTERRSGMHTRRSSPPPLRAGSALTLRSQGPGLVDHTPLPRSNGCRCRVSSATSAASVTARFLGRACAERLDFQIFLTRYALERLLYRLSVSPHRDRFNLKGAMLFATWVAEPFRPTRDMDLLGYAPDPPRTGSSAKAAPPTGATR